VPLAPDETTGDPTAFGVSGLVQYLVFEGQDHAQFIYHTRIPGVDYMPSGGPYPVTDALASEPMAELVQIVKQEYTLVLVVGPALARSVDTEILAAYADGMIVVLNNPLGSFSPAIEEVINALKEKHAPLLGTAICV
jgi:Mrp family chromosome partitioning ATPase